MNSRESISILSSFAVNIKTAAAAGTVVSSLMMLYMVSAGRFR